MTLEDFKKQVESVKIHGMLRKLGIRISAKLYPAFDVVKVCYEIYQDDKYHCITHTFSAKDIEGYRISPKELVYLDIQHILKDLYEFSRNEEINREVQEA